MAPTLSQVTVSHVMLASLRQVSLGLTVLLCTTGVLEPLLNVILGVKFIDDEISSVSLPQNCHCG